MIFGKLTPLKSFARLNSTYTKIKDVSQVRIGDRIQVKGWVQNFRKQSKFVFLDVKDGSSNEHLQVMIDKETHRVNPGLGFGATVSVAGEIGQAPKGHLELRADKFTLNGVCPSDDGIYPFVRRQNHSLDYIRQHLHLRAHDSKFQAIFRARHLATRAFHDYFDNNAFTLIHTPTLTSNSCEGAGELFAVQPHNEELLNEMQNKATPKPNDEIYFNQKVFLTLSGQMHLEAMCFRLGSVYNFGPVFRSENSQSSIHMSEFYMIEAEEAFVDGVDDITRRMESAIKTVTKDLLEKNLTEINDAHIGLTEQPENDETRFSWLHKPFITITYAEATEILQKHYNFDAKMGLSKSDELLLVNHLKGPLFVVHWPRKLKPFYMRTCKHDPTLVEAIDFLMPTVGELAGGSVREDNYDVLAKVVPEELKWYMSLRKYGGCTTGGFGIGFDRYLQVLLGISNIKDTIPFPRWPHHCSM